ncbi:hypothetical protein B0H16DRAFT_1468347 [Mycena metata]|uniref:Uncharacterized protein n=1 Tax=Mycena metata TaxID=1033252 RepID=A0AAD7MUL6_9AGAR|nr:hypothetical protein B0H16DRAFT_1468347 [Mycena metata]
MRRFSGRDTACQKNDAAPLRLTRRSLQLGTAVTNFDAAHTKLDAAPLRHNQDIQHRKYPKGRIEPTTSSKEGRKGGREHNHYTKQALKMSQFFEMQQTVTQSACIGPEMTAREGSTGKCETSDLWYTVQGLCYDVLIGFNTRYNRKTRFVIQYRSAKLVYPARSTHQHHCQNLFPAYTNFSP